MLLCPKPSFPLHGTVAVLWTSSGETCHNSLCYPGMIEAVAHFWGLEHSAFTFSSVGNIPSFVILCPKYSTSVWRNLHFDALSLILAASSLVSTSSRFRRWYPDFEVDLTLSFLSLAYHPCMPLHEAVPATGSLYGALKNCWGRRDSKWQLVVLVQPLMCVDSSIHLIQCKLQVCICQVQSYEGHSPSQCCKQVLYIVDTPPAWHTDLQWPCSLHTVLRTHPALKL